MNGNKDCLIAVGTLAHVSSKLQENSGIFRGEGGRLQIVLFIFRGGQSKGWS